MLPDCMDCTSTFVSMQAGPDQPEVPQGRWKPEKQICPKVQDYQMLFLSWGAFGLGCLVWLGQWGFDMMLGW
jgi:hypothetical protein